MKILDFDAYLMRHGEAGVQYMVEQVEKTHGIRYATPQLLEYRWHVAMNPHMPHLAAAVYGAVRTASGAAFYAHAA